MPETLTPPSPLTGAPPASAAPAPAAPAAPKPAAPSSAPAAAPAPSSKGMHDFIAGLTKKPDASPAPEKPPVGDTPPVVPPAGAPAAPEPEVDVTDAIWDKAPKNLKNAFFKYKRETGEKLTATESKIKELEGKPNQTPADLRKIQQLEERAAKLEKDLEDREQRLVQTDYRSSKEFQEKYEQKGQRAYQQAIADVKRLQVKEVDGDGTETFRPATEDDFNNLRALKPFEQDKKVNEMFGTSAWRVANHMRQLETLESEANDALATAKEKADENRRNFEKQHGERSAEYKGHAERTEAELLKTHAQFFAPDPTNPEASAALERGLKYVDEAAANTAKMSPKDLAETTSMIRFLAGSAPRLMTEINQLKAKLAAKDEELAKYRKSSPGSAPAAAGAPRAAAPEPEKRGLAAVMESMKNAVKK